MNNETQQNDYTFSWTDLGDIELGRPNLGNSASVLAYRLLQYTFKDVLTKSVGRELSEAIFMRAGHLSGTQFCRHVLDTSLGFDAFLADLARKLVDWKIGVMRIEKADVETLNFTLTFSEDLDCSGLPVYGETVCGYDEGFFAGILECYTGKPFTVKEVDCWATGNRTCRFTAAPTAGVAA